jgi:hypothetical protein
VIPRPPTPAEVPRLVAGEPLNEEHALRRSVFLVTTRQSCSSVAVDLIAALVLMELVPAAEQAPENVDVVRVLYAAANGTIAVRTTTKIGTLPG